jgi:GTP-binding protein of the ras superfamily involved in termination of M-phase
MAESSSAASSSRHRSRPSEDSGTGGVPDVGTAGGEKNSVVIKVGMVGDSQIGKTSLMVKYVEGSFE